MRQIETDAEPTTEFRDLTLYHTCPCGEALVEGSSDIGRATSKVTYRCPNDHRWLHVSMLGRSSRWERLEGVGA